MWNYGMLMWNYGMQIRVASLKPIIWYLTDTSLLRIQIYQYSWWSEAIRILTFTNIVSTWKSCVWNKAVATWKLIFVCRLRCLLDLKPSVWHSLFAFERNAAFVPDCSPSLLNMLWRTQRKIFGSQCNVWNRFSFDNLGFHSPRTTHQERPTKHHIDELQRDILGWHLGATNRTDNGAAFIDKFFGAFFSKSSKASSDATGLNVKSRIMSLRWAILDPILPLQMDSNFAPELLELRIHAKLRNAYSIQPCDDVMQHKALINGWKLIHIH